MWEVIIPTLLIKRVCECLNWLWTKEEGEEGAERLKLVSIDGTLLGQYVVFVAKGDEKCVTWVSIDRKRSATVILLRLSDAVCFIFISTFIDVTHKLFKPKAVFCNAYILPQTLGHISIAQLMILQESRQL